jgi:hypothetical protein
LRKERPKRAVKKPTTGAMTSEPSVSLHERKKQLPRKKMRMKLSRIMSRSVCETAVSMAAAEPTRRETR